MVKEQGVSLEPRLETADNGADQSARGFNPCVMQNIRSTVSTSTPRNALLQVGTKNSRIDNQRLNW